MPNSINPLEGYYRLNVVKFRNGCRARGIASDKEATRRLAGTIGYNTLMRMIYDKINPSARSMFAVTQLLGIPVEELFDPVAGEIPVDRAKESA